MAHVNPVKAIREKCLDCCGGSYTEVKACTATNCAIHPFRFGKNPYRTKKELTDDQRSQIYERLAKAKKALNTTERSDEKSEA